MAMKLLENITSEAVAFHALCAAIGVGNDALIMHTANRYGIDIVGFLPPEIVWEIANSPRPEYLMLSILAGIQGVNEAFHRKQCAMDLLQIAVARGDLSIIFAIMDSLKIFMSDDTRHNDHLLGNVIEQINQIRQPISPVLERYFFQRLREIEGQFTYQGMLLLALRKKYYPFVANLLKNLAVFKLLSPTQKKELERVEPSVTTEIEAAAKEHYYSELVDDVVFVQENAPLSAYAVILDDFKCQANGQKREWISLNLPIATTLAFMTGNYEQAREWLDLLALNEPNDVAQEELYLLKCIVGIFLTLEIKLSDDIKNIWKNSLVALLDIIMFRRDADAEDGAPQKVRNGTPLFLPMLHNALMFVALEDVNPDLSTIAKLSAKLNAIPMVGADHYSPPKTAEDKLRCEMLLHSIKLCEKLFEKMLAIDTYPLVIKEKTKKPPEMQRKLEKLKVFLGVATLRHRLALAEDKLCEFTQHSRGATSEKLKKFEQAVSALEARIKTEEPRFEAARLREEINKAEERAAKEEEERQLLKELERRAQEEAARKAKEEEERKIQEAEARKLLEEMSLLRKVSKNSKSQTRARTPSAK